MSRYDRGHLVNAIKLVKAKLDNALEATSEGCLRGRLLYAIGELEDALRRWGHACKKAKAIAAGAAIRGTGNRRRKAGKYG